MDKVYLTWNFSEVTWKAELSDGVVYVGILIRPPNKLALGTLTPPREAGGMGRGAVIRVLAGTPRNSLFYQTSMGFLSLH